MIKSRMIALVLVAVLSVTFAFPAFATTSVSSTSPNTRIYGDDDVIDDFDGKVFVWEKIDDSWKCTDSAGDPVRGWAKRGNLLYFLSKEGFPKTGWIKDNNSWYYMYSESDDVAKELIGTLATETWIDNYYVDKAGVQIKIKK